EEGDHTEDTIRQALRLDDAAGVDCLPNEEIFAELARMGYEKPMVRNVDSPLKFLMYLQFLQLMLNAQVDDLSSHNTKYTSPALIQKVFANMRRISEGFSGVDTPLFDGEVGGISSKATTTITVAQVPKASAPRRRRVIQDPKETATASVIMHSEVKSKDKGKGIVIKEPKPLKRQAQIKQDEAFGWQLEAELNGNINWDDVMEQARKKMMIYLKNMVGFKMDFFKWMTYNDIRPIFEKHYNSIRAFLEKGEKEIEKEGNKRKGDSLNQDAAKKQRIDEETEELKTHLQIVANDDDDDVYTEATPLALKVSVVDYQIHHEHNKPYYKIIRADGTHQLFVSFITLLKNINIEDLEMLWKLVQERFQSSEPKNFSDNFLLNTLKTIYEKPNVEASIWRYQKGDMD
nr:hypothetical protein [Tanacetum cinerariifolium]